MSDYLGLTLETVSRQIGALKRDGVIRLVGKRGVIVPDLARLVAEAGDMSGDGGVGLKGLAPLHIQSSDC